MRMLESKDHQKNMSAGALDLTFASRAHGWVGSECQIRSTSRSPDGPAPPLFYLLNKPMISARASVLKCRLKPTTAAEVSAFTSSFSAFTANTVNR